ncbi:MAG: VanZ family protein [Verrucomicrobia bacterium]|nr:VanZ family protein [Verrucomicrobiota bacterium]
MAYWLPVFAWMLLIFIGSTNVLSSEHTSRFIGPLLRWLIPGISEASLERVHLVIRKCGHLSEYAVLGWLLWRARRQPGLHPQRPWRWAEAVFALGVAAAYAGTDEFHQSFYPSRYPSFHDVCIDTVGAAIGLLAVWALGRWRKQW